MILIYYWLFIIDINFLFIISNCKWSFFLGVRRLRYQICKVIQMIAFAADEAHFCKSFQILFIVFGVVKNVAVIKIEKFIFWLCIRIGIIAWNKWTNENVSFYEFIEAVEIKKHKQKKKVWKLGFLIENKRIAFNKVLIVKIVLKWKVRKPLNSCYMRKEPHVARKVGFKFFFRNTLHF